MGKFIKKIISIFLLSICIFQSQTKAYFLKDKVDSLIRFSGYAQYGLYALHGLAVSGLAYDSCKTLYDYFRLKNTRKTKCKKIENEQILTSLKNFAKKITDKKIKFYTGNAVDFGSPLNMLIFSVKDNTGKDSIIISPEYYKVLEIFFNGEIPQEQTEKTLNILNFLIQHESTHLKNGDTKTKVIASLIGGVTKVVLFELIYFALAKILNNPLTKLKLFDNLYKLKLFGACLISYAYLNIIHILITTTLNKHQEYRADASVVGEDAIEGGKLFFNNLINIIKNNPQQYWLDKLNISHPTTENRLKHLEAIAQ